MANITKRTETVLTPVEVEQVVLTLSPNEAQALVEILARVGTKYSESGIPRTPPRAKAHQVANDIFEALERDGFYYHMGIVSRENDTIYFLHEDDPDNEHPDLFGNE